MKRLRRCFMLSVCLGAVVAYLFLPESSSAMAQPSMPATGCPSLGENPPHIYVHRVVFGQGQVVDVPFDDYVIGVVEGEIFPGSSDDGSGIEEFDLETIKAQAVIARTFALSHCGDPVPGTGLPGITDSEQAYLPRRGGANYGPLIRGFVEQHTYLAQNDDLHFPVEALFKAYTHSGLTHRTAGQPGSANLLSVYDPVMRNKPNDDDFPPRIGFGQNAGNHWATGFAYGSTDLYPRWDYSKILAHYYSDAQYADYSEVGRWGPFRWNMLLYTPTDGTYYTGEARNVTLHVQNTGTQQWISATSLHYRWKQTQDDGTVTVSAWQQVLNSNGTPYYVPLLAIGADGQIGPFSVTPPGSIYAGSYHRSYQIEWDMKLPGAGGFFKDQGWLRQEWPIRMRQRVVAPQPQAPPCHDLPCALNVRDNDIQWLPVDNLDAITYRWRHQNYDGDFTDTTTGTQISLQLEPGTNNVYVKAFETADSGNSSDETLVFHAIYDPYPPTLSINNPPPLWTNLTQVSLSWSAIDPDNGDIHGEAVQDFTLEQQVNGGGWATLLSHSQAEQYTATGLADGNDYTFRVTARDVAGNISQQTLTTRVDRTVPTSQMTSPSGSISKTWAVLQWSGSDARSGIVSYIIDLRINGGTWQQWRVYTGEVAASIFEGEASTNYEFRIRAVDAAGNTESVHSSADITFTTGTDSSGLSKEWQPLFLVNQ